MTAAALGHAVFGKAFALAGWLHRRLTDLWCLPVRLYIRFLSPLKGRGTCRFTPTCSRYFILAVKEWGIVIGTLLGAWRVLRCNPFSKGGYDPPPTRRETWDRIRNRLRGKKSVPGDSPTAEKPAAGISAAGTPENGDEKAPETTSSHAEN